MSLLILLLLLLLLPRPAAVGGLGWRGTAWNDIRWIGTPPGESFHSARPNEPYSRALDANIQLALTIKGHHHLHTVLVRTRIDF
ncbi:unnamed protein product [Lampetra fluviatilis]